MVTVLAAGSRAVTVPVVPRFFQSSGSFCCKEATSPLLMMRTVVAAQVLGSAGGGPMMTARSPAARAETQAGKGSLAYDHPQCMGAIGATGTLAANRLAHDADLVIGIGTRYSDFTSASMTAFQNPAVRFVNINTAEFDACKVSAIPLVADARVALQQLAEALPDYQIGAEYATQAAGLDR